MNAIDPDGEAPIRNTNVMMTDSGSCKSLALKRQQEQYENYPSLGLFRTYDKIAATFRRNTRNLLSLTSSPAFASPRYSPSSREEYIYSQTNDSRVAERKYGLFDMSYNGCELIAIYNAMISLGDPQTLNSIIDWGEVNSMALFGLFGTNTLAIGSYFTDLGYEVDTYMSPDSESLQEYVDTHDVVIFSYWNGTPFLSSVHTVMIKKEADGNYYGYNYQGGRNEFDFNKNGIIVYGINAEE